MENENITFEFNTKMMKRKKLATSVSSKSRWITKRFRNKQSTKLPKSGNWISTADVQLRVKETDTWRET